MATPRIDRLLAEAPRWLLVGCLAFAPWAYGSTRTWAVRDLSIAMGVVCLLWLVECLGRRRRPGLPSIAVIAVVLLLIQGWWMALNAHSTFDADLRTLLPCGSPVPWMPGSANGPASIFEMFFMTGLLGTFLFCCNLARHSIWRRRMWLTMIWTGVSIAAFGLLQKIGGDPVLALTWEAGKRDITNNFAMFRYRGNAGAFLNLIFPLAAGWVCQLFQEHGRPWSRAAAVCGLFLLVLGIQVNPSRASWAIALGIGVAFGWKNCRNSRFVSRPAIPGALIACGAIAISAISFLGRWETSWNRFDVLGFNVAERSPTEIYLRMIPDAGLAGFGPNTFGSVFPSYQETYDFGGREVPRFWTEGFFAHAHEDYLETMIDWGYLGTFLWSVLVFGGIGLGVRRYLQSNEFSSSRWLLFGSLLTMAGVLIQALIDFPLQIASIQLYVFVLLGICWGKGAPKSGGDKESWQSSRARDFSTLRKAANPLPKTKWREAREAARLPSAKRGASPAHSVIILARFGPEAGSTTDPH
jgi:hypothetical protein